MKTIKLNHDLNEANGGHGAIPIDQASSAARGWTTRTLRQLASALMLAMVLPLTTQAATWYVDNAATGANKGTTWTDAWNSFASIVWGSSGVKAGDTLFISGGATAKLYAGTLTIGASGTATSRITIALDAGNPAHNGVVTFDFDALGDTAPSSTVAISCSRNYVTISGNVNGSPHIVIKNLRNINSGTSTFGIYGTGTTGVIIEYVAANNCNNPIRLIFSTGFAVRYCSLRGVRGDAAICVAASTGGFDASEIHHNTIEQLFNVYGPDGIQSTHGVSIHDNSFVVNRTTVTTSTQHPDTIQATGNYTKIYNNEFRNVGDSSIDFDCFDNSSPHDFWIYNNLFLLDPATAIDPYPEFFRLYISNSNSVASINNFKILNNTFVNSGNWMAVFFKDFNGNPTSSGCEIKNNLFYNCGSGTNWPTLLIGASTGFTASDWDTDANLWYATSGTQYVSVDGTALTTSAWIRANEPKGSVGQPTFVNAAAGDYRPAAGARQIGAGVDLSQYFTTDKSGAARPSGAWTIGAFEYSGTIPPSNARIAIIAP